MAGASPVLGTMLPSPERSLVVLDPLGELAVALRELLDPGLVVVKHAYPAELPEVVESCRPWPWMVVGAFAGVPGGLCPVLGKPVLVAWLGDRPSGLPRHALSFARFGDLAEWVGRTLQSDVAGMRLAVGSGVDLPGGCHVRSAELQALISAGALGFALPQRSFRGAARILAAHGLPLRPAADPASGRVRLRSTSG